MSIRVTEKTHVETRRKGYTLRRFTELNVNNRQSNGTTHKNLLHNRYSTVDFPLLISLLGLRFSAYLAESKMEK